jgi:hypothetical protein
MSELVKLDSVASLEKMLSERGMLCFRFGKKMQVLSYLRLSKIEPEAGLKMPIRGYYAIMIWLYRDQIREVLVLNEITEEGQLLGEDLLEFCYGKNSRRLRKVLSFIVKNKLSACRF